MLDAQAAASERGTAEPQGAGNVARVRELQAGLRAEIELLRRSLEWGH